MRLKTTAAATAIAALAVPATAFATDDTKPEKSQKPAKTQKAQKAKAKGFTLSGTELAGLTVTDGKVAGPFTLDLTSANKHARTLLGVTKAQVAGDQTTTIPAVAGDALRLRLNGVTDGADAGTDVSLADVLATDRVKVIGKVTRDGALDIRKITVKRAETETEQS